MNAIPHLDRDAWLARLPAPNAPSPCQAMYSSVFDGIVTDPALMLVPVDDHLVHRGDGVFETVKCVDGGLYNLEPHLDRLFVSAAAVGLEPPCDRDTLRARVLATVRAGGQRDAALRILLSRGPGSMGIQPADCPAAQLYIVASQPAAPFLAAHPAGARIGLSSIPPKPPPFAAIKSCNYLPNALMAREGRARGLDFVIGQGPDGRLLEGPTENIALVDERGWFLTPDQPDVLPGTTLEQVMALTAGLIADGTLQGAARQVVPGEALRSAREIFIIGTSHDLLPVGYVEPRTIASPPFGPVYNRLAPLLKEAVRSDATRRTPV